MRQRKSVWEGLYQVGSNVRDVGSALCAATGPYPMSPEEALLQAKCADEQLELMQCRLQRLIEQAKEQVR